MSNEFTPGVVYPVAPAVRRLTAGNGGFMTGPGTNTYLVGTEAVAVIDPGPDDEAHLQAVAAATEGRARWILVTHNHPDHSSGARRLAALLNLPVYAQGSPLEGVCDPVFEPDVRLAEGDEIGTGDARLHCLHTPGHAADHLCFLQQDTGLLFAGDHVMAGVTVVIAPPDGDMRAYLDELARLAAMSINAILPGHGGRLDDPANTFEAIVAHRLQRERQVLHALMDEPRSIEAIVASLYAQLPAPARIVAGWQVDAHLRKLAADERARRNPDDGLWQRL